MHMKLCFMDRSLLDSELHLLFATASVLQIVIIIVNIICFGNYINSNVNFIFFRIGSLLHTELEYKYL
jgi:hypothetical protein